MESSLVFNRRETFTLSMQFHLSQALLLFLFYSFTGSGDLTISNIYNGIKLYCDQKYGIPTQCVKAINVENTPPGYFKNLLLKGNGKVGGQNQAIDEKKLPAKLQTPTMVIGMDVTHPTNLGGNQYQEGRNKSIVGAVASYSSNFAKFVSVVRIQERNRIGVDSFSKKKCCLTIRKKFRKKIIMNKIERGKEKKRL